MGDRRAGLVMFAWLVAASAGCFRPAPVEGAPCSSSGDCPTPLQCFDGRCLLDEPPPTDAEPPPPDPDAPADGPAVGCTGLACDDFESGDLSAWAINRSQSGLTVVLSTAQAHSGTQSVETLVPPLTVSGQSAYVFRTSPPPLQGVMAARAFVLAPQPIADFSGVMIFRNAASYAILTGDSTRRWTVTEQTTTSMLVDHRSSATAVQDRWTCVEMNYTFQPPHIELYVDDQRVLDLAAVEPAPAYTEVGIGVTRAPIGGFHVFVDDVVIADKHIGCN
jgi:hypothetical protein